MVGVDAADRRAVGRCTCRARRAGQRGQVGRACRQVALAVELVERRHVPRVGRVGPVDLRHGAPRVYSWPDAVAVGASAVDALVVEDDRLAVGEERRPARTRRRRLAGVVDDGDGAA